MTRQEQLYQWSGEISSHLSHLSKPQASVLALWSYGMALARSCALTTVLLVLAPLLGYKENTLRQRLREWYRDADKKKGAHRKQIEVSSCFAPLLGWILSAWNSSQLALAIDATTLGSRFVVLAVSVVYRGCAIPVAWTILPTHASHPWRKEWLRMLRLIRAGIPKPMTVIVLADRGLYARWLFGRIVRLGWHPFLRINTGGKFRPAGTNKVFKPLSSFAPQVGSAWCGQGTAFTTRRRRLECTLLARWDEGYKDPWLILTDLPPESCDACWYGLRSWIENGFKITKSAGWQWNHTRMSDPARASRLWLAIAVATLWLLSVGGDVDETIPESTLPDTIKPLPQPQQHKPPVTRPRKTSLFRNGWARILVFLLLGNQLPLPLSFTPESWPDASSLLRSLANTAKEEPCATCA